jgi:hypothetical protein
MLVRTAVRSPNGTKRFWSVSPTAPNSPNPYKPIKRTLIIAIVAAISVLALFKGCSVQNYWWYGGQTSHTTQAGPGITIWVDTNIRSIQVGHVKLYSKSQAPYGIRLEFHSEGSEFTAVRINDARLKYSEGEEKQILEMPQNLETKFEPYNYSRQATISPKLSELLRALLSFAGDISLRQMDHPYRSRLRKHFIPKE